MKLEYILTSIVLLTFLSVMTYTSHKLSNCQRDKAKQIATQQIIDLKVKDEIITTKTYQQKLVRKTSNSASVSDRAKWLQLIYAKGNSSQN